MKKTTSNNGNKILIALFLSINAVVLYNAVFHLPWIGYDSVAHIKNILILSKFRLPTPQETYMFYVPPLGYILPALLHSLGKASPAVVLKFAQLLNVLYSLGLTFCLIKICGIIRPNNTRFKIFSLLFLGMLPVYYKTFSFIRSEPLVAFLIVFAIYKMLIIFVKNECTLRNIFILGITLGLAILCRRTAFFVFPAIIIFVAIASLNDKQRRSLFLKSTVLVLFLTLIVGGWYYLHLYKTYGTIATYNVEPKEKFSFSNQPKKFYFDLAVDKLFTAPVRKSFPNQLFPIFYSETWGDYLCYFIVYGRDVENRRFAYGLALDNVLSKNPHPEWLKTNYYTIKRYLGRVNFFALFPSAIMLAGLIFGTIYSGKNIIHKCSNETYKAFFLIQLVIVTSLAAYLYFLIMYPSPVKGDNIKATYMLHIFPFIAILAGDVVCRIKQKSAFWYKIILILLLFSTLHNAPVFFTRYTFWQ